eukprot:gnl/TRDRNA2_/TRDRNA2_140833_c0_seq1.p1 gnl/TRDRNA2_/TRDRNA2_140833_c0~~gnl/TRDRNA2_/TRDRNA2_140833_c0_seq1.p1  ORF type:complete len:318 (-),score=20.88 gnl/TRDRNA2_/TRDRNA2_140833_c0_seq1:309-1148(-)
MTALFLVAVWSVIWPAVTDVYGIFRHHYRTHGKSLAGILKRLAAPDLTEEQAAMIGLQLEQPAACSGISLHGNYHDGGWYMCETAVGLPHLPSSWSWSSLHVGDTADGNRPCVVYSAGIKDDWSFDDAVSSRYDCEVFAFDPWIQRKTGNNFSSHIHFYRLGLRGNTSKFNDKRALNFHKPLLDLMKMLGHTHIDVLKMDIEKFEWDVFADLFSSNSTPWMPGGKPLFCQLLVEVHFSIRQKKSSRALWSCASSCTRQSCSTILGSRGCAPRCGKVHVW